jgi:hypothetical protein
LERNLKIFTSLLATGKKSIFKHHEHSSNGNQKYKHRSFFAAGSIIRRNRPDLPVSISSVFYTKENGKREGINLDF